MHIPSPAETSNNPNPDESPEAGEGGPQSPKKGRRKDRERIRVTRACDRCKKKKARCNGKLPCALCVRLGLGCDFSASYTRGKVPHIISDALGKYEPGTISDENEVKEADNERRPIVNDDACAVHGSNSVQVDLQQEIPETHINNSFLSLPTAPEMAPVSSRNSPEPPQTDLQGHYVGPSSGVAFLLRAQKRLHEVVSLSPKSSIFTFGDSPLPEFDASFLILPSKNEAQALVARYFDFAFPTHRFLHRPSVESWLDDFYTNLRVSHPASGVKEKNAIILMVMAQAKEYMPPENKLEGTDTSAIFFGASENQLATEKGEIRLTSVQARLAQCFYLLSQSRINHCWSLFGTTARLGLAIGIHRRRRKENPGGLDMIDTECRTRVFWCAYSLDNYLSAALGRPRCFHDDDIDQELPICANDSDILASKIRHNPSKAQSVMLAPIYHARLSQIISGILKDLYGIRRLSTDVHAALASKYTADLRQWRSGIEHFLDLRSVDASLLVPLFQRQSTVLNLAFGHALILIHRPFLLSNFASLARPRGRQHGGMQLISEKSVADCLEGALTIVNIVNELCENGQIFKGFWFTNYYAFCAIVVLYVYTIQRRSESRDAWESYFSVAQKCQRQLNASVGKSSFANRYGIVLEELRLEALRQTREAQDPSLLLYMNLNRPESELPDAATNPLRSHREEPQSLAGMAHLVSGDILESARLRSIPAPDPTDPSLSGCNNSVPFGAMVPAQLSYEDSFPMASPNSLMAEMTGWGEFDSLVTAGTGDFEAIYSRELAYLVQNSEGSTERWNSVGINGDTIVRPGDAI